MNIYEILTVTASGIAIIVSLIAIIVSFIATKNANDLTKGQVELQIRAMVSDAKRHYAEMLANKPKTNITEQDEAIVRAALEDVCNTYEEACAKYVDGKVDKTRFKKMYSTEIRQWVESGKFKNKYIEPHTQFHATIKVYKEWNNLEK